VAAAVVGGVLAVGGAYSAPGQGPFPAGGLIQVLKGHYGYSWVVGFAAGFLVYLVLAPLSARARSAAAAGG
jgi:NCS1 family nucleobase:cation symporter-1